MAKLIFVVSVSLTSSCRGTVARGFFARSRKIFGSPTYQRTAKATRPGTRPTTNMPRQPMSGSRSGVTSAATSTPACQPSAT